MSEQETDRTPRARPPAIRVSETSAEDAHGSTKIKPGDKVLVEGRMQRVIEVYPNKNKLKIHKVSGMHSDVETIHAEAVKGYKARDEQ